MCNTDESPTPMENFLYELGTTKEIIEGMVEGFCMDLRTMAFYTDFLFTKESKQFRYDLRREPW